MSKTNNYGSDCILLDSARRRLLEASGEALKYAWLIQRRIKGIYGHALPASAYSALAEQREKIDWLIASLEDFREYMEEGRAWAPAEEQKAGYNFVGDASAAMDGLLDAIGGKANSAKS